MPSSLNPHSKQLESHHIDRNRENNVLRNGRCLCSLCHGDTRKIKYQPRRKLRKIFYLLGKRQYKELLKEIDETIKRGKPKPIRETIRERIEKYVREKWKKSPYPNLISKEEVQNILIEELSQKAIVKNDKVVKGGDVT